ncbi:MAG TPA: FAD-dependent oxidoreductase [Clostridiales bacterium]|nr:FAD-dependent oxidoreductase [Clostridiales bacterium]HQP69120.1 FAD-dependent oxidoreductase [Clostridiales bacterium]
MKTDVLVIGSSAAGLVVPTVGKRVNPDKKFTVVTKQNKSMIPCGIPYIFGSVGKSDNNILPAEKMYEQTGVEVIHDEVMSVDKNTKVAVLASGESISFEILVFATGSEPVKPKWLNWQDKENVFFVPKDKVYLDEMQQKLSACNSIVTIGAGFIGVEISDELTKTGKKVTLIEKLPNILGLAFDKDISEKVEAVLKERGVNILTGCEVKEITGTTKVEGVKLSDGTVIAADAVIISMGYKPNTQLAKNSGIILNDQGFIKVDEYMRTCDTHIFAVGDCAEKKDFVTGKSAPIMLASTACAEARIAGMNLFKLSVIKTFSGTISIFSTAIGNNGFGVAGMTEAQAIKEGFEIITGTAEGIDRHPGSLSDSHKQYVKLVVAKDSGVILGGAVFGGLSAGELINVIGVAIQNRMDINALFITQVGTHPLLTASPAAYPLIKAVESAIIQLNK